MPTDLEGNRAPASLGSSPAVLVAVALLLALAVAVFVILPRWNAAPVVITDQTAARDPKPLPSVAADPRPAPRSPVATPAAAAVRPAGVREEPVRPAEGPRPPADPPSAVPPPESAFDTAVSEGLRALDRGAAEEARAAFLRAEALRPGTGAVKDGLARAEGFLRASALEGHRERGRAAEAAEDWRAAQREYEAALRLEPTVRFAVEGVARATARADLSERLDLYLRRPDRLSTPAVADEAEIALDRAREVGSPGPRLRRQIEDLSGQLAAAGVPVAVRLLSDERTEVTVLRVGPQGRFREKSLELRPGTYVVVGTRPGYRDSRQTLVVPPGRSPAPLTVRCDEAL